MARAEWYKSMLGRAGARQIRETPEGFSACCLFHREDHPSMAVNVAKGVFCCYSPKCGAAGRFERVLEEFCRYTRGDARAAVDAHRRPDVPRPEDLALPRWEERRAAQRVVAAETLDEAVLGIYRGEPAYMLRRGYARATLAAWEIGWDRDGERVVFPVRDLDGRLVGLTKRAVEPGAYPRYLNQGFRKSEQLYGAHRLDGRSRVVVVEGPTSVLRAWQAGVPDAVATFGAAVSVSQRLYLTLFDDVVLAFDGDAAGRAATHHVGSFLARWNGPRRVHVADAFAEGTKDLDEQPDPLLYVGRYRPWGDWLADYQEGAVRDG